MIRQEVLLEALRRMLERKPYISAYVKARGGKIIRLIKWK